MKPLFLIPLFFLFQPLTTLHARPMSAPSAAAGNHTATSTPSAPRAEGETPAKKDSATPSSRRPADPKPNRPVRPGYLFME